MLMDGGRPPLPYKTLDPQTNPRPPLDGCLISGSYGRRWNDPRGQRAPAEIAFTDDGRRFFQERAAARDLALFARMARISSIRRAMKRGATAPDAGTVTRDLPSRVRPLAVRQHRLPSGEIGVWSDGRNTLELSQWSPGGRRLYIVIREGRIHRHNLEGLAFVF
jgi:hypothetical protein